MWLCPVQYEILQPNVAILMGKLMIDYRVWGIKICNIPIILHGNDASLTGDTLPSPLMSHWQREKSCPWLALNAFLHLGIHSPCLYLNLDLPLYHLQLHLCLEHLLQTMCIYHSISGEAKIPKNSSGPHKNLRYSGKKSEHLGFFMVFD